MNIDNISRQGLPRVAFWAFRRRPEPSGFNRLLDTGSSPVWRCGVNGTAV